MYTPVLGSGAPYSTINGFPGYKYPRLCELDRGSSGADGSGYQPPGTRFSVRRGATLNTSFACCQQLFPCFRQGCEVAGLETGNSRLCVIRSCWLGAEVRPAILVGCVFTNKIHDAPVRCVQRRTTSHFTTRNQL